MARSREILLLPGLLVAVFLAAAPGDAAALRGCQPEVLASTVALFCTPGQPAEWCCQALAHSARVGGGARCLCRLAPVRPLVRAGLNATYLLSLHAACASRVVGGAAHKPSACDGDEGAPAAAAALRDTTGCAPAALADRMELFCGRGGWSTPNWLCCVTVCGWAPTACPASATPRLRAPASTSTGSPRSTVPASCGGRRTGVARHLANMCPRLWDPA